MERKLSNIKERILYFTDEQGVTKEDFFKKIGMTYGNFKGIQKKSALNSDAIERILSIYPEINTHWLLTGKGEMLLDPRESITLENKKNKLIAETTHTFNFRTDNEVSLPMLPIKAVAGVFTGDVQVMEYECDRYVVPMFQGADFLIPVLGDSMYPSYNNGDVIACRKLDSWTFFQFGKVYVIYTSQGVIVKRVKQGGSEDTILIVSDNGLAYPAFELDRKEILGVALVIGGLWME